MNGCDKPHEKIDRKTFLNLLVLGLGIAVAFCVISSAQSAEEGSGTVTNTAASIIGELQANTKTLRSFQCRIAMRRVKGAPEGGGEEMPDEFDSDVMIKMPDKARWVTHFATADILMIRNGGLENQYVKIHGQPGGWKKKVNRTPVRDQFINKLTCSVPPADSRLKAENEDRYELEHSDPRGWREVFYVSKKDKHVTEILTYESDGKLYKRLRREEFFSSQPPDIATKIVIENFDASGRLTGAHDQQLTDVKVNAAVSDQLFDLETDWKGDSK
ncbi:MAG: hypothetical protein PHW60_07110 [Kiritimatiellae bacterium]|nr:hypothetical protein [Kiritimatiellia bacterium]